MNNDSSSSNSTKESRRKAAMQRAALIKQSNEDTQAVRAKLRQFRRSNSNIYGDAPEDAKHVEESLKVMDEVIIAMKRESSKRFIKRQTSL